MSLYGTAVYGSGSYGTGANTWAGATGAIVWIVQVDWDRDGVWGSEIEPQSITKMRFLRGRKNRVTTYGTGQEHPERETFQIELRDVGARYDSFNASSPLANYLGASGMAIRILGINSDTKLPSESLFVGTVSSIYYDAKRSKATITGEGLSRMLETGAAERVYSDCQPFSPLNAWSSYFVSDGSTPFPVNWWKGRPNGLPYRECVALTLAQAAWSFGAYYGSVTNAEQPDYFFLDGGSAWAALKELTDGFAARLFFLRDGRLMAMDRTDAAGLSTSGDALAPTGVVDSFGLERPSPFETLRNQVNVKVRPHSVTPFKTPYIAAYYTEAWSNSGPVEVAPSTTVLLDIEYSGDAQVGSFVSANTSGFSTNSECWSAADRTGTRMDGTGTGDGEFSVLTEVVGGNTVPYGNKERGTRISLQNHSATLTAYFFDLKVMLIGVLESGLPGMNSATDAASILANGLRQMTINSRWVQTSTVAGNIATAYVSALAAREKASPVTLAYHWNGATLQSNLLAYDLGTFVSFGLAGGAQSLKNFGMWGRWLIVGQEVEWMDAIGQDAIVKMTYEFVGDPLPLTLERTSTGTGAAVTSVTVSHQVDAKTQRALVVLVSLRAGQTVSTVSYGGQALSLHASSQYSTGTSFPRVEMWYLVAPTVGTANVVVTVGAADFVEVAVVGFYNAAQGTLLGAAKTTSGAGAPASAFPVVGAAGDIVLDGLGYSGSAATPSGSQTLIANITSDGTWRLGTSRKAGAANVTMSWTPPAAWAMVAAAVKAGHG